MVLLNSLVLIETNLLRIDGGFKCAIVGMGSARYMMLDEDGGQDFLTLQ